MAKLTQADFVARTIKAFPELWPQLQDNADLLHVQVSDFGVFTKEARDRGDWSTFERCVGLINELFVDADEPLMNAINVSFLEEISFDGPQGVKAWELMPPRLQDAWRAMDRYNADFGAGIRRDDLKRRNRAI